MESQHNNPYCCANVQIYLHPHIIHGRIQLLFVGAHIVAHCTRSSRSRDMTFAYSSKGHRMSCASPRANRQPVAHFGKTPVAALAVSVIKRHTFHAKHCVASGNLWRGGGEGRVYRSGESENEILSARERRVTLKVSTTVWNYAGQCDALAVQTTLDFD